MAAVPPVYTVRDAMIACGINDAKLFMNKTEAQRIATDLFQDSFNTCMNKTFDKVDSDLKTYSVLTLANGQIRITPGQKNNLKAFIQWTRDQLRNGLNPEFTPFPVDDATIYIRRYKTHENYVKNSSSMAEQSKPSNFKDHMRWQEWEETFLNYLRVIPGRDGAPLKYIF